jgi:nitrogen regulatory protein P-II 1
VNGMKRIEAIVRPEKIGPLTYFLKSTPYPGLMITKIEGYGRQEDTSHLIQDVHFQDALLPKLKMEIIVADREVPKIVKKIKEICHSWKIEEGKIFISPVANAIRIRTMQQGEEALE